MSNKCILAIRIRGGINVPKRIKDTLKMLRMDKNNTSTLLDNRPDYLGMLQKAKDCLTWGEPDVETIHLLLEKRGRIEGDHPLNGETVKLMGFEDLSLLAAAIHRCEVDFNKLEGIKPFFRLHPPKKGFKRTVKRPFRSGGELGYRGESINELATRMA